MLPGTVLCVVGADALFKAISQKKVPWVLVGVLVTMGIFLTLLILGLRRTLPNRNMEIDENAEKGRRWKWTKSL